MQSRLCARRAIAVLPRRRTITHDAYPEDIDALERKAFFDNDVSAAHRAQWLRKNSGLDWPYLTPIENEDTGAESAGRPRIAPLPTGGAYAAMRTAARKFGAEFPLSFYTDAKPNRSHGAIAWRSTSTRKPAENTSLDEHASGTSRNASKALAVGRTVATLIPPPSGSAEYGVEDGSTFVVHSPPTATPVWQVPRIPTAPPRWIHEAVVRKSEPSDSVVHRSNDPAVPNAPAPSLAHSPFSNLVHSLTQVEFPPDFAPANASEHLIHSINNRRLVPSSNSYNMDGASVDDLKALDAYRNRRAWISAAEEKSLRAQLERGVSAADAAAQLGLPEALVRSLVSGDGELPRASRVRTKTTPGKKGRSKTVREPESDFKRILYMERRRRRALW